jgi:hypothetical protein
MKKLVLILSVALLTTCVKKEIVKNEAVVTSPDATAPISSGKTLGTDIILFPKEIYTSTGQSVPVLRLAFLSTKLYPCVNYSIALTAFQNQNELTIRLDSIQKFSGCFTAIGPATAEVPLGDNIRTLVLMNGTQKDKYDVEITASSVRLTKIDTIFSHLRIEHLHRYLPQTVAVVCGSNFGKEHLENDFAKILVDSAGFVPFQYSGKGVSPYPDSSSGSWVNHATRLFKYQDQAAFVKSGSLLKNFKQKHLTPGDGVNIYLSTWDNQYFRSWML